MTTDDLDGSPGAEPVSFGLDDVSYEIDLARAQPDPSTAERFARGPGRQAWRFPSAAGSTRRS